METQRRSLTSTLWTALVVAVFALAFFIPQSAAGSEDELLLTLLAQESAELDIFEKDLEERITHQEIVINLAKQLVKAVSPSEPDYYRISLHKLLSNLYSQEIFLLDEDKVLQQEREVLSQKYMRHNVASIVKTTVNEVLPPPIPWFVERSFSPGELWNRLRCDDEDLRRPGGKCAALEELVGWWGRQHRDMRLPETVSFAFLRTPEQRYGWDWSIILLDSKHDSLTFSSDSFSLPRSAPSLNWEQAWKLVAEVGNLILSLLAHSIEKICGCFSNSILQGTSHPQVFTLSFPSFQTRFFPSLYRVFLLNRPPRLIDLSLLKIPIGLLRVADMRPVYGVA